MVRDKESIQIEDVLGMIYSQGWISSLTAESDESANFDGIGFQLTNEIEQKHERTRVAVGQRYEALSADRIYRLPVNKIEEQGQMTRKAITQSEEALSGDSIYLQLALILFT